VGTEILRENCTQTVPKSPWDGSKNHPISAQENGVEDEDGSAERWNVDWNISR
jgi:hypothetical protein